MVGAGSLGRSAVFLDRDGVLNRPILRNGRGYAPRDLGEFELLPGVGEAVRILKDADFLVIVVTNQKDVGLGLTSPETLAEMHRILCAECPIDEVRVCICPDDCPCYKPRPGMLLQAAQNWGIDLKRSFMVGDTWRDMGAGSAVGATTIFIDWGYTSQPLMNSDHSARDLCEAVDLVLQANKTKNGGP